MKQPQIKPKPAKKVEVTVLVDNYSDTLLMDNTGVLRRPRIVPQGPIAEHGLSMLVKVSDENGHHSILMDTGLSEHALLANAGLLGADLTTAKALVISHGHWDHLGGLKNFLALAGKGFPVVVHPEAFSPRRLKLPDGAGSVDLPGLSRETLAAAHADLCQRAEPSTLAGGMIVVLGEVERQTPFEKGFPAAQAMIDGNWVTDPLRDDQGLAVIVEGRGLVVISGCAHAGIVNTVLHARRVTGEQKVHAVLGGFHLTGPHFAPVIEPTVKALRELAPDWLAPMHCTGWNAGCEFARAMPDAFLLSTVGTTLCFQGP